MNKNSCDPELSEVAQASLSDNFGREVDIRFFVGRYIHDTAQQELQLAMLKLTELVQNLDSQSLEPAQIQQSSRGVLELLVRANEALGWLRREILPVEQYAGMFRAGLEAYFEEKFPQKYPQAGFIPEYELEAVAAVYDLKEFSTLAPASEKMLIALFVEEGFRNAYKHAGATKVTFESEVAKAGNPAGYYLKLTIRDNGTGFNQARLVAKQKDSFNSFIEFERRAQALNGFTKLESAPETGTEWSLYIPIQA